MGNLYSAAGVTVASAVVTIASRRTRDLHGEPTCGYASRTSCRRSAYDALAPVETVRTTRAAERREACVVHILLLELEQFLAGLN